MNHLEKMKLVILLAIIVVATTTIVSGMKFSSSHQNRHKHPSERLLDLLSSARQHQKAMKVVGVHDALSARIVQQQHERQEMKLIERQQQQKEGALFLPEPSTAMGLFVSGFGVSAARIGRPDVSILTRYEIEDTARNIISAVSSSSSLFPPPPVIVDGDTGFGGTANVRETVRRMAAIKAAAITIEDQIFPKRCTYIAGTDITCVSREESINRIRTALAAQKEAYELDGNKILIIARTDCRMSFGLDEAIERCLAFQQLGADIVYAENLQSELEYRTLRKAMIDGGSDDATASSSSSSSITPMLMAQFQTGEKDQRLYTGKEVSAMGYEMTLYGVAGLQATVSALQLVSSEIFDDDSGCDGIVKSASLSTLDQIKDVVGISELDSFEEKYGCI